MKNATFNYFLACCFTVLSLSVIAQPLTDGMPVFIQNCDTGEYLNVGPDLPTSGTDPNTVPTSGPLETQWAIIANSSGGFNIDGQVVNPAQGRGVLRATGTGDVIGTNISPGTTGSNGGDKRWTITYDAATMKYSFKRVGNTRSLRANAAGASVTTEVDDGSDAFKWTVAPVAVAPLDFAAFKAQDTKAGTQLTWEVSNVVNNSHFEILKGTNADEFQSIGRVEEVKDQKHYEFLDRQIASQTVYYKLKQVDLDGKISFSKMISVKSSLDYKPLVLYPNPVGQNEYITVESQQGYQIFNSKGMLLKSGTEKRVKMDLEKGIYYIKQNESSEVKRFIVF